MLFHLGGIIRLNEMGTSRSRSRVERLYRLDHGGRRRTCMALSEPKWLPVT
jgi:hypothetical protein